MAVFSWGANSHGQLGLGYENELCMTPQRLTRLPFNANTIRTIKGGGGHVLLLNNSGQLYACGWNNRGQLGIGTLIDQNQFQQIPSEYFNESSIIEYACGWDTSGAITTDQLLYVWGSNSFQQLGICKRCFTLIKKPLKLKLPCDEIPKKITFGLRHSAVLTNDNKIYIFGKLRCNDVHPDIKLTKMPFNKGEIIKIQTNDQNTIIQSIVSGQNHLLIAIKYLNESNSTQIIGVGENKFGQINTFRTDDKIQYICAGWTHNGIITNNQQVLLWGRNTYGQIGGNDLTKDSYRIPNKLQLPIQCNAINLHIGSEHNLIVASPFGQVFTWGWNEHGNCGNGTTENLYIPNRIELPSACRIAGTGAGFCYVVCVDD